MSILNIIVHVNDYLFIPLSKSHAPVHLFYCPF